MRCESAASIKRQSARRRSGNRGGKIQNKIPHEGTYVREVYDLFYSNKGKTIPFTYKKDNKIVLTQLQDFYGLDIRHMGKCKYCLAGEWFGRIYIDYTINPEL